MKKLRKQRQINKIAMEAKETKVRKEAANWSYLAAILRSHLSF